MPPSRRPKASTPPPPETDDNDPNSPATIPTETPAPTPVRPSTGTLPTRGRGGVRGGRGGRGASAAAPSKFKPKIIRREQSEREGLAREELKRKQDAADAAAREEARGSRGGARGFPSRGRGDAMGRGREQQRTTSTGVFGVLPAAMRELSPLLLLGGITLLIISQKRNQELAFHQAVEAVAQEVVGEAVVDQALVVLELRQSAG